MMRMPRVAESEEPQSMSAMIDIVFLLLIFFIVTMSSYVEMTLLETNLPASAAASDAVDLQKVVKIEISADGLYAVNGTVQSPDAMQKLLKRYGRLMPEAEFLLQCDPESKHQSLVSLLADLAAYRLKNVKLLK